jgi:hypothetical protein
MLSVIRITVRRTPSLFLHLYAVSAIVHKEEIALISSSRQMPMCVAVLSRRLGVSQSITACMRLRNIPVR